MEKKYYEHICPCGNKIEIKSYHKYSGVPKVCKSGHIGFLREKKFNTRLQEGYRIYAPEKVYICICGCGRNVNIKKQHRYTGVPRYISGHNPTEISDEGRKKISGMKKGISRTEEEKKHIAEGTKKAMTVEVRKNISERMKGKRHPHTEETKKKLSGNRLGNKNPFFGKTHDEETRRKMRKNNKSKELWQNVDFVRKVMKAWKIKPNKPELQLQSVLNELYPNEFKYVGDGEVIIAGKCPDFINVNGKKQIIELYGDYWHRGQNPQDRIKVFEPYGYKTLIIWEKELKDRNKVKHKLIHFIDNKGENYGAITP
mgnify:CR=1 FL=1